ncbi:hypothetical protein [Dethiobacter alkaliphilus]|uniref:Uncharacterized protein n=1 Tax=Dethiobacter alkaliphilus AHT 1 TaxID=555088 RepID=C0GE08_DETAL|nr:hypothetical protein [Dethiobacter alkaliphilus]EEG78302.1 hypothetical protein DealDRAFT_0717 [Dethiobacter alkaliphilus AHT 1]MCW3490247.1 hypothetical protein [Dethiobacter alkaliphilus]
MQIITKKDRFIFTGTIRELRFFLRNLPADITLRQFIQSRLH